MTKLSCRRQLGKNLSPPLILSVTHMKIRWFRRSKTRELLLMLGVGIYEAGAEHESQSTNSSKPRPIH